MTITAEQAQKLIRLRKKLHEGKSLSRHESWWLTDALIASEAARKLAEERLEKIAPLLDRAVNGPWLNGDLERARAILKEIDNG